MHSTNNREWVAICDAVPTVENKVEYFYSVYRQATEIRREWQQVNHHLELPDKDAVYVCYDRWNDIQEDSYLYSSAFTEAFNRHTVKPIPQQEGQESQKIRKPITIKVHAPQVESDESLYLVGEGGECGQSAADADSKESFHLRGDGEDVMIDAGINEADDEATGDIHEESMPGG